MKSFFKILFLFLFSTANLFAQNMTSLGDGVKTLGEVYSSVKDTINNRKYIGGSFNAVNGLPVQNVAMFDGTNWSALGTGISGTIITMKMINGELYVAGYIQSAGGVPVNNIAKWNGNTWSSVGQGLPYIIREIEYFQGKIYITGFPPNTAISYLASFDGTNWNQNLGSFERNVNGLFVRGNELFMYGSFERFNTDTVNGLISFNGSSFSYYPKVYNFGVQSAQLIDTTIYVSNNGGDSIRYFNGSQWIPYYNDTTNYESINSLFSYHDSLYMAVDSNSFSSEYLILRKLNSNFSTKTILKMRKDQPGYNIQNIYTVNNEIDVTGILDHIQDTLATSYFHYDGSQWTNPGKICGLSYVDAWINSSVNTIAKDNQTGEIYIGGSFLFAGTTYSPNVARWDGTSWHAMSAGLSSRVNKLIFYNNELYAFGNFGYAGSTWVGRAAKWNGSSWVPFGIGFPAPINDALIFNNELYVCGDFTSANGVSANYIAKYDGTSWMQVGDNMLDENAEKMVIFNNQLVVSADYFFTAQSFDWSTFAYLDVNSTWQLMDINFSDGCSSMLVHNNQLFTTNSGPDGMQLYKWDGTQFNFMCYGGGNWDDGILLEYRNNLYSTIYNGGFFKFDSTTTTLNGPIATIQPYTILEDGSTDYFGGFFPSYYLGSNKIYLNCIGSLSPVPPVMSITTNTDTICERENIYYNLISTDPFATYSWHFGGGTPDTLSYSAPIIQYFTSGSFTTYLVAENLFGADTIYMNGTITVLPCLSSISEINNNTITAFPNPFTENINFNSEKIIERITISDITGKIIYQSKPVQNSADLSFLEAGIYIVSCQSENSISTIRIIKQ